MERTRNLGDAIDGATSADTWPTVEQAPDGQGVFVVLRHDGQAVGFHLTPVGTHAGGWLMAGFAVQAIDPASDMTSRTIRALPIGELLTEARRHAAGNLADRASGKVPARLTRPSEIHLAPFLADRRGRGERTDEDYAGLALEYALLLRSGERSPVKALAARYGGVPGTWGNRVAEARRRGLLTPIRSGEAGGAVTDKALRLLGHRDEDESE